MIHGVPLVVVFLSRLAGILALSKIARIFAIRVRVMTVGVTLERRTVCACGGSGGGQAQKRREGESRDDLRHRRLLWVSGPFRACSVNVTCRQYRQNVAPLPIWYRLYRDALATSLMRHALDEEAADRPARAQPPWQDFKPDCRKQFSNAGR